MRGSGAARGAGSAGGAVASERPFSRTRGDWRPSFWTWMRTEVVSEKWPRGGRAAARVLVHDLVGDAARPSRGVAAGAAPAGPGGARQPFPDGAPRRSERHRRRLQRGLRGPAGRQAGGVGAAVLRGLGGGAQPPGASAGAGAGGRIVPLRGRAFRPSTRRRARGGVLRLRVRPGPRRGRRRRRHSQHRGGNDPHAYAARRLSPAAGRRRRINAASWRRCSTRRPPRSRWSRDRSCASRGSTDAYRALRSDVEMRGRGFLEVFPKADRTAALLRRVMETGRAEAGRDFHAPIPGRPDARWDYQMALLPPTRPDEPPCVLVLTWETTGHWAAPACARTLAGALSQLRRRPAARGLGP